MNKKEIKNWVINEVPVMELDPIIYGFIYEIEYSDGDRYIGAKKAVSELEMNCLANGEPRDHHVCFVNRRKGGKIIRKEKIRKPSNWKKYEGSYKQKSNETMEIKKKTIIDFCFCKKDLTVSEVKFILLRNALYDESYRNSQVLGKIFSHEIKIFGNKPQCVNNNVEYEDLLEKSFEEKKYKG